MKRLSLAWRYLVIDGSSGGYNLRSLQIHTHYPPHPRPHVPGSTPRFFFDIMVEPEHRGRDCGVVVAVDLVERKLTKK